MFISIVKEYEIALGNRMLLKKIISLDKESQKRGQEIKKQIAPIKKYIGVTKKNEIIRMTQENQLLLKRLQERGSYYNVAEWVKEYERSQYYKRNHCIFPSIDFYKAPRNDDMNSSNNNNTNSTRRNNGLNQQRSLLNSKKYSKSTRSIIKREPYAQTTLDDIINNIDITGYSVRMTSQKTNPDDKEKDTNKDSVKETCLYTTKCFIGELGECIIDFIVQKQR